jgi:hypothetical protein
MKYIKHIDGFLNEGRARYDSLTRQIVKETIDTWVADWKKGKKVMSYETYVNKAGLVFDIECNLYLDSHPDFGKVEGTFQSFDSTGADSSTIDLEGDDQDPYIVIELGVLSTELPGFWSSIYMYLSDIVRHEIEHITQGGHNIGNYKPGKPDNEEVDQIMRQMINRGLLPKHSYLLLPKEVDANLQGLRYAAKKQRISMMQAIDDYLATQDYLTPKTREQVLAKWRQRAKEIGGIPKF